MNEPSFLAGIQNATLDEWLRYLATIHYRPIDLSLDRVFEVAKRMALQTHFKTITVTGTNGKGSTATAISAILQAAGYRVGLYTSPHLLHYNERIRINGHPCTDEAIVEAFTVVETARRQTTLTYFEFGTLAALWLFKEAKTDVVVLEVGLGGRLDAVNIIDADCAVITNVDIEHSHYLGTTRESIALEKAGIMRQSKPAIFGESDVPRSLLQHAQALDVPLSLPGRDFHYDKQADHWCFVMGEHRLNLPYPPLLGEHQLNNASLAIAALLNLQDDLPVTPAAFASGIQKMHIQGRLQCLGERPTIYVDVAHNPHAVGILTEALPKSPRVGKTISVFAALDDKDIESMARIMAPFVDLWLFSQCAIPRAASVDRIAVAVKNTGAKAMMAFPTIAEAWYEAKRRASPDDWIVVFGSFHTVAEVLRDRGI